MEKDDVKLDVRTNTYTYILYVHFRIHLTVCPPYVYTVYTVPVLAAGIYSTLVVMVMGQTPFWFLPFPNAACIPWIGELVYYFSYSYIPYLVTEYP